MKSKGSTYVLGAIVLLIWGAIFLKILNARNNPDTAGTIFNKMQKMEYNDYSITDTTRLLLNYPDPFRLTKVYRTVPKESRKAQLHLDKVKARSPGVIIYSGYIRSSSDKVMAMLNINGKNVLLKEGQTIADVKLIRNMKDSVKIAYHGSVKYIRISIPD